MWPSTKCSYNYFPKNHVHLLSKLTVYINLLASSNQHIKNICIFQIHDLTWKFRLCLRWHKTNLFIRVSYMYVFFFLHSLRSYFFVDILSNIFVMYKCTCTFCTCRHALSPIYTCTALYYSVLNLLNYSGDCICQNEKKTIDYKIQKSLYLK